MATPETKYYPETQEVQETQETQKVQEIQETQEVPISEEEAAKMVKDILKSPDTLATLNKMKDIEEKVNALPEDIKNLYKKAKDSAMEGLKKDPDFQLIMKQVWWKVDKNNSSAEKNNDIPLSEISEKDAESLSRQAIEKKETWTDLEIVKIVIWYNKFNDSLKNKLAVAIDNFKNYITATIKENPSRFKNILEK